MDKIIYVQLLDEGTTTYRPVNAEQLSGEVYKILDNGQYKPDIETWEFLPGQIIKVEKRKLKYFSPELQKEIEEIQHVAIEIYSK